MGFFERNYLEGWLDLKHFQAWSALEIPTIFDQSLSYYEVLGKIVVLVKQQVVDINILHQAFEALIEDMDTAMETMKEEFYAFKAEVAEMVNNQNIEINEFKQQVSETVAEFEQRMEKAFADYKSEIDAKMREQDEKIADAVSTAEDAADRATAAANSATEAGDKADLAAADAQQAVNQLAAFKEQISDEVTEIRQDVADIITDIDKAIADSADAKATADALEGSVTLITSTLSQFMESTNTHFNRVDESISILMEGGGGAPATIMPVITKLSEDVDALQADYTRINDEVETLVEEVPGLDNRISIQENRLIGISGTVSKLVADMSGLTTTVTGNSSAITGLRNDFDTITGGLSGIAGTVTQLKEDVKELQECCTTVQVTINDHDTRIAGNATKITTVTGTVARLVEDLNSLDTEVGENTADITRLTSEVQENASNITLLQQTDTTTSETITDLQNKLQELKALANTLQGDISTMDTEINQLVSKNTEQEGKITQNTTSITALRTRIGNAEAKNTSQDTLIAGLRTDVDGNAGDIANAEASIAINTTKLNTFGGAIKTAETDIDNLQKFFVYKNFSYKRTIRCFNFVDDSQMRVIFGAGGLDQYVDLGNMVTNIHKIFPINAADFIAYSQGCINRLQNNEIGVFLISASDIQRVISEQSYKEGWQSTAMGVSSQSHGEKSLIFYLNVTVTNIEPWRLAIPKEILNSFGFSTIDSTCIGKLKSLDAMNTLELKTIAKNFYMHI